LFGSLDDDATLAREVTSTQDGARVLAERRRRHLRTVRKVARSRNPPPHRPHHKGVLVLATAMVVLAVASIGARAEPPRAEVSETVDVSENDVEFVDDRWDEDVPADPPDARSDPDRRMRSWLGHLEVSLIWRLGTPTQERSEGSLWLVATWSR
jgi:hypothetical protein